MEKQFPQVLVLGKGVIKRINKRGPVSLFSFIPKVGAGLFSMQDGQDAHEGGNYDRAVATLGVEWRQDELVLGMYMDSLLVVRGNTDLFGAIHSMTEALNAKVDAEKDAFRDKVIILITDGEHRLDGMGGSLDDDEYERKKQERQLIKELREGGIRVYALGLIRELNAYGGYHRQATTKEGAESFLKKITKETGGCVVFPKSKNIHIEGLLNELLSP